MTARVDTRAMLVRHGAMAIAFAADCGAGTAVLDPAGAPHPIRLLRWREKCLLARFADAAPEFLEAQFVAISSGAAPDDPERREALSALVFWLHGATPLPLDIRLLGEVTLDLCAALGIGPAALGELAVPEVETLWHARDTHGDREEIPAGADVAYAPSGVTRIQIEPDPPEAAALLAVPAATEVEMSIQPSDMHTESAEPVSPLAVRTRTVADAPPASDRTETAAPAESGAPWAQDPAPRSVPPFVTTGVPPSPAASPASEGAPVRQADASPSAADEGPVLPEDCVRSARAAPRFRFRVGGGEGPGDPSASRGATSEEHAEPGQGDQDAPRPADRYARVPKPGSLSGTAPEFAGASPAARASGGAPVRQQASRSNPGDALPAPESIPVAAAMPRIPDVPADSRRAPGHAGASTISAMISAVAPARFSNAIPRDGAPSRPPRLAGAMHAGPRPNETRPPAAGHPTNPRLDALVEIVARSAAPRRDDGPDPDAMVDSFGDRLADAVAELGLAGAD